MKGRRVEGEKVRSSKTRLKASKPFLNENSEALYDYRHFAAFSADSVHLKKASGGPKGLIGPPCHGALAAGGRKSNVVVVNTRRKFILFLNCVLFLASLAACGGGEEYADAKEVLGEVLLHTERFVSAANGAQNVDDAVAAIDKYYTNLSRLSPALKKVMRKYPGLKENPPEELEDLIEKLNDANRNCLKAMAALDDTYGQDPEYTKLKRIILREASDK
jgi:hypothetical protein